MSGPLTDRAFSDEEMAEFEANYWQHIFFAWQEQVRIKDELRVKSILKEWAKEGKFDA